MSKHSAAFLSQQQIKLSFPGLPAFVDFPSACRFVGVSRQTGDHWLAAGKFPAGIVRLGTRKIGVPLAGLQVWLEGKLHEAGFAAATDAPVASVPVPAAFADTPAKRGRGRPRKVARGEV